MKDRETNSLRKSESTPKAGSGQRIFAVKSRREGEDAHVRENAERAIRRVLHEWSERENGRLQKIPATVEELVRFHCLDYERRQKALDERDRHRAQANEGEDASKPSVKAREGDGASKQSVKARENKGLHTDTDAAQERHRIGRQAGSDGRLQGLQGVRRDTHGNDTLRIAVVRKKSFKNDLPAPVYAHYRRLNMLIDLSLSLACEEGVRATMRHDIAERRGDRRTALYYVDRRAYLRQKRMAKLSIAAALGLL